MPKSLKPNPHQIAWRAYRDKKVPVCISAGATRELQKAFMAGLTSGLAVCNMAFHPDVEVPDQSDFLERLGADLAAHGYGTPQELRRLESHLVTSAPAAAPRETGLGTGPEEDQC